MAIKKKSIAVAPPQFIERGEFCIISKNDIVSVSLGNPNKPDSEFLFSVHKVHVKDIIAGLTAINS